MIINEKWYITIFGWILAFSPLTIALIYYNKYKNIESKAYLL